MLKKVGLLFLLLTVLVALLGAEEISDEKLADIIEKSHSAENNFREVFSNKDYIGHVFDTKGYLWYMTKSKDSYEVYRYDNHSSEIMLQLERKDDDLRQWDSLLDLGSDQIAIVIEDYFYVWDKYKFKKYNLLEDDKIVHKNKKKNTLLIVGNKGYYHYQAGEFYSHRYDKSKNDYLKHQGRYKYNSSDDFTEYIHNKLCSSLDSSNNLFLLYYESYYINSRYKYNSSDDFNDMKQLVPRENDLYLNIYNDNLIDSLKIITSQEYNSIINPMVVPEIFTTTEDKSYLFFKYTNYLYEVDSVNRRITKQELTSNIKIIQHFIDDDQTNWIIYHDDGNIYLSKLSEFLSNKEHQPYTYQLPLQEANSGGSYCLIWENRSLKFITKGVLNNKNFKDEDYIYKENKDFKEQYRLNYVSFLKIDSDNPSKKLVRFFHENRVSSLKLLNISDNMLISKIPIEDKKNIIKLEFYDLVNSNKVYKYFNYSEIQYSWSLTSNMQIKYDRRNNRIELLFMDVNGFNLYIGNMSSLWSEIKTNNKMLAIDSKRYFKNDYIISKVYSDDKWQLTKITEEDGIVLSDTLLNMGTYYPNNTEHYLYFLYNNEGEINFNMYDLRNKTIQTKLMFSQDTKYCISDNKILLVEKDCYMLYSLQDSICTLELSIDSPKLNNYIDSLNFHLSECDVMDNYLFLSKNYITNQNTLYNLETNDYQIKDNWIWLINTTNSNYVMQYESDTLSSHYNLTINEFSNGELIDSANSFFLSSTNPQFYCYTSKDKIYPAIIGDTLFYYFENHWETITDDFIKEVNPYFIRGKKIEVHDNKNGMWFDYNYQLANYNYKHKLLKYYNQRDGLPNNLNDFFIINEENCYVIGEDYYNSHESQLYKLNKSILNPTIDISWLEVNGQRKDLNTPLKFTSTENNITIPVAILNYMYPEEYPMKYKLTGFDKDWKVGTYNGKITYENLNPGKYTFDVQAFPTDFSDMSWPSIEFRILPPWYRAWWAYSSYALFLSLVIYLIFKQRVKLYKKNQEILENKVNERTHELSEKTVELTEQQKKMRESIEYASLIQRSILPQSAELEKLFSDYFVIWKPRDIVGGDFYWLYENPDQQQAYLSVIDCTGHGVPGALLSMTVNSLLNHTIKDKGTTKPAKIIQELHQEICSLMHQKAERSVQDGFEIALIKFDFANKTLTYSGAGLNIVIKEPDKELFILKGDRYNVGGQKLYANINFTEESYTYVANTKIYLYSDGIVDQPIPGSERVRRLGYKGWIEKINSLQGLTMNQQSEELISLIESMLVELEQRDDITIMGVEI